MNVILAQDWLIIPAIGVLVFIFSYLQSERVISWLHRKSLGEREEVIRLMELMFIEVEQRKVTWLMLLLSFGLGALAFAGLWPRFFFGVFFGSILTIIGWQIPKRMILAIYEKRCSKFVDQMVDGMTMMANGIKAGLSVQQSMERVQENMPNPISQEFGLVLSQMRLGRSMSEALNDLGTRIPRPDVQMFVTSVNILQETGGNMGETFQTIVYTIRERQKVEKKIEALTAQGIMQGVIITLVPFFLLIIFAVIDPGYVKPLFNTTAGIIALTIMLILQVIGGLAIKKIVKINV